MTPSPWRPARLSRLSAYETTDQVAARVNAVLPNFNGLCYLQNDLELHWRRVVPPTAGAPPQPIDLTRYPSGRLSADHFEVRWYCAEPDRAWFWRIEEHNTGAPACEAVECSDSYFYLRGIWQVGRGFVEDNQSPAIDYPLEHPGLLKQGDRPRVLVRQYRPVRPAAWPTGNLQAIVDTLNQPAILAHRFLAIDAGTD